MKHGDTQIQTPGKRRFYAYSIAFLILFLLGVIGGLSTSYRYAYLNANAGATEKVETGLLPFPVGVDPHKETIVENPSVETYFSDHLSNEPEEEKDAPLSLMKPILGKLALFSWYQNLASLSTRILVIEPGERKEQVAQHFGKILGWDTDERREFVAAVISLDPILLEGKFAPGTYVAPRDAKPYDVALMVTERFNETVLARYPSTVENVVPLENTLIIASLLEREAYDFEDMRYIAGVIWNRLFIDMKLQIDATLQYAKGEKSQKTWWPRVVPQDKYIESAFNTYQNEGLPPTPIANPSANAILAALNPRETDCIYYFHDKKGGFHCTKTYEEHVELLKQHYGRGK